MLPNESEFQNYVHMILVMVGWYVTSHGISVGDWGALSTAVDNWIGPTMILLGIIGNIYSHHNSKLVPENATIAVKTPAVGGGPFTRLLPFMLGALLLGSHPAHAAPMVTKTAPMVTGDPLCTLTDCVAWFAEGGISGQGSNANIIGNGIDGSVFAGGGIPYGGIGWQYWDGVHMVGFEATGGYSINTGSGANGVNVNPNGYDFTQKVQLGGNLTTLIGGTAPVTPPSGLAAAMMFPYLEFGLDERTGGTGWLSGAGLAFLLGPKLTLRLGYDYVNYGGGVATSAATTQTQDNRVFVSFQYLFAKP